MCGAGHGRLEGVLQPLLHAPGRWRWSCRGRSRAPRRRHGIPAGQRWARRAPATAWMAGPAGSLRVRPARAAISRLRRARTRGVAAARGGRCRRSVLAARMGIAALPCGEPAASIVVAPVASSCLPVVRSAALADAQPAGLGASAPAAGTAMRAGPPGATYRCGSRLAAARRTGLVAGAAADPAGRGRAPAVPPRGGGDPAGVARQALPADSVPLAPELRRGEALDGRADQFALAALFYWLLCGRWPSIACPESDGGCRYEPWASVRRTCRSVGMGYWRGPWRRVRRRASKRCRNSGWPCRSR